MSSKLTYSGNQGDVRLKPLITTFARTQSLRVDTNWESQAGGLAFNCCAS
jgi:hypothetical protein